MRLKPLSRLSQALMPRACALAVLATPYLAGLWRLFLERPGLALEGASWLAEFALGSARGRWQRPPDREAGAGGGAGAAQLEVELCTPCPAPERCVESEVEQVNVGVTGDVTPAPAECPDEVFLECECEPCAPCPAPERCPEFEGPPWVQECEPVPVLSSEPALEATPASWWQLVLGAATTFGSGLLASCGCRSAPWEYGSRRAHYSIARAHVRGVLRG